MSLEESCLLTRRRPVHRLQDHDSGFWKEQENLWHGCQEKISSAHTQESKYQGRAQGRMDP